MQNKKRLHRHLLLIYIIYFAALIVGFAASFVPDFSRGWRDAQDTTAPDDFLNYLHHRQPHLYHPALCR